MNRKLLLIILVVNLLIPYLWNFETTLLSPFHYVDELLGAYSLIYIFKHWQSLSKYEKRICVSLLLLTITGLVGTYVCRYQLNVYPIIMDAFMCSKCFLVFVCCNHIVFNMPDEDKIFIIQKINRILPFLVIVAFFFAMMNLVSNVGMHDRMRFGMRAFSFLCEKSGSFSDQYFYYLLFLTVGYRLSVNKRFYIVVIVFSLITWMLTLRTRSIVYAPVFFMMFYLYIVREKQIKIGFASILLLGVMILSLGAEKMDQTYQTETSGPRAVFLHYGIKTMVEHMPIGAGFATFGTDMAAKYYSPLYYKYGINHYWGMNEDDSQFLHDTYWPAIMGQFGLIGIILIAFVLYNLGREMVKKNKVNKLGLTLAMFLFLTRVLNSLAVPAFFSSGCVFMFLIIPLTSLRIFDEE